MLDFDGILAAESMPPSVLADLVVNLPPESATMRAAYPDLAWTPDRQLLAAMLDHLRMLVWMLGDGDEKSRPKQIPRPGVEPDEPTAWASGDAMTIEEACDWLGW